MIPPSERLSRKTYPSYGECIYCGPLACDVKLTDEHVMPYGLGGNIVIKDGSCKTCADETSKVERVLSRPVLGNYRNHINEQSYRKNKRPKTGSFMASLNNAPPQRFTVPIAHLPYFTGLPIWGYPGMLDGKQPSPYFEFTEAHLYSYRPPNLEQILGLGPHEDLKIIIPEFKADDHKVARAILKIGYCNAILFQGLRSFDRMDVPAIILGKNPNVPFYVGCSVDTPSPPDDASVKHGVSLVIVIKGDIKVLVAKIRLYANAGTVDHGMPVYWAVVGKPFDKEI